MQFQGAGEMVHGQVLPGLAVIEDAQVVVGLPEHGVQGHGLDQMGLGLGEQPGPEVDAAGRFIGNGVVRVLCQDGVELGQGLLIQSLIHQQVTPLDAHVQVGPVQLDGLVEMHQGHFRLGPADKAVAHLLVLLAGQIDGGSFTVGELIKGLVVIGLAHAAGKNDPGENSHGDDKKLIHDGLLGCFG